jgi:hypothetical protein
MREEKAYDKASLPLRRNDLCLWRVAARIAAWRRKSAISAVIGGLGGAIYLPVYSAAAYGWRKPGGAADEGGCRSSASACAKKSL